MKSTRFICTVAAAILMLSGSGAAQPPRFTFKIPVELENLHQDVDQVQVVVRLFTSSSGISTSAQVYKTPPPSPNDKSVTSGVSVFPVGANRSVSRTVTLKLNPKEPQKLKWYMIAVYLHNKKKREWALPERYGQQGWLSYSEGRPIRQTSVPATQTN